MIKEETARLISFLTGLWLLVNIFLYIDALDINSELIITLIVALLGVEIKSISETKELKGKVETIEKYVNYMSEFYIKEGLEGGLNAKKDRKV